MMRRTKLTLLCVFGTAFLLACSSSAENPAPDSGEGAEGVQVAGGEDPVGEFEFTSEGEAMMAILRAFRPHSWPPPPEDDEDEQVEDDEQFETDNKVLVTVTEGSKDPERERSIQGLHCEWSGVTCGADNKVIRLELNVKDMEGTIPRDIASLRELERLYLFANQLT